MTSDNNNGSVTYQKSSMPPAMQTEEISDANGQSKAVVVKIMHRSSSTGQNNGDESPLKKFPPQAPSPRAIWRRKRSMNGRSNSGVFSKMGMSPSSSSCLATQQQQQPPPPPESPSVSSCHSSPSNASLVIDTRNDEPLNDTSRDLEDGGEGSPTNGKQTPRTKNRGLRGVAVNTVKLMRKRSSLSKTFRRGSGSGSASGCSVDDLPPSPMAHILDEEDGLVPPKSSKLRLDMSHEDPRHPQDAVSAAGNTMSSTSTSTTTTAASSSSSSGGGTSGPPLQRSSSTSRKRYITKTSIVQHNFITTESGDDEELEYSGDEADEGGGPPRRISPSAGAATPRSSLSNKRSSTAQLETEAIECVFSAMSFHDSEEEENALRESRGEVHQGFGQMERERSLDSYSSVPSTQAYAMGSRRSSDWFILHADPQLCGSDSEDLTDDNNNSNNNYPSNNQGNGTSHRQDRATKSKANNTIHSPSNHSPPARRRRRSSTPSSTYESGRIVHLADVVSTERNFANFLEAYDDLCRKYNRSQRSLALAPSKTKDQQEELHVVAPSQSKVAAEDSISAAAFACPHCMQHPYRELPPIPPGEWPQRPLLLRATPGTGMKILGVRYCASTSYLAHPWPQAIQQTWTHRQQEEQPQQNGKRRPSCKQQHAQEGYTCPQCQILPINGGTEPVGESLVIDFESEYFLGTLLLRIRDTKGSAPPLSDQSTPRNDYFSGKDRKYQAVIRGRFKRACKMTESVTGQAFARPCGHLPNKWILKSAIQVVSIFAPQLQAKFDGLSTPSFSDKTSGEECEERIVCDGPSFLSPLASTPQVVMAEEYGKNHQDSGISDMGGNVDGTMEQYLEEPAKPDVFLIQQYYDTLAAAQERESDHPTEAKSAQLPKDFHKMSSNSRARMRKKFFDKLYAKKDMTSEFDTNTIYTFEFLQHLVNFETFSLDIGGGGGMGFGGTMKLLDSLGGQPLKCMGATGGGIAKDKKGGGSSLKCIWSFDIWHEGLYKEAMLHDRNLSSMSN